MGLELEKEKRDEEEVGGSKSERERRLAIRESKERRKDCFLGLRGKKAGVARERLVAKEWEEREKEKKREFLLFSPRVEKKGEDPRGPVGSSFW